MSYIEPFREFFIKETIDFKNLNPDTIVIFDTNTLLNIYRYSESIKDNLISAMDSIKTHIWMPYQVGLEFNLRRRKISIDMKLEKQKRQDRIITSVNQNFKNIENEISGFNLKSSDVTENKKRIISDLNKQKEGLLTIIEQKLTELESLYNSDNDLAERIADIFKGKIGSCYTQAELDSRLADAEDRFNNDIPPGYKDKTKTKDDVPEMTFYNGISFEKQFGDLIIWYQIIDKAKSDEKIKKVVFITDDNKEDWWYKYNGQSIGPRAELKNELLREANTDLFMLNTNSFLNNFSDAASDLILIEDDKEESSNVPVYLDSDSKKPSKITYYDYLRSVSEDDEKIPYIENNFKPFYIDADNDSSLSNSKINYSEYFTRRHLEMLEREKIKEIEREKMKKIEKDRENGILTMDYYMELLKKANEDKNK